MFYPDLDIRDKIGFYSVFGGYPFILERLDANKSLEENIEELLLGDMGSIREEIENTILKEIAKAGLSREIIARIGNSRLRFKEIEDSFSVDVRGTLDREIKRLIEMQLIEKSYPINKKDDRKKSFYELSDNLLRFYYSYIFPVKSRLAMLSAKAFYKNFIEESLNTFISKRFEGIAREYFIRKNKEAPESSIIDIGTYWYDDKTKHINGEFDCVLKTLSDEYEVYEVKYLKEPMTKSSIEKEVEKIKSIVPAETVAAELAKQDAIKLVIDSAKAKKPAAKRTTKKAAAAKEDAPAEEAAEKPAKKPAAKKTTKKAAEKKDAE